MSIDDEEEVSGVFEPAYEGAELSPEERARTIAGRYVIEERIGAGGMGQVLRVRHRRLGKAFALKLMQAEFSLDPESRKVFHREARLASALTHPNIVSIVDFGEDPDWGLFIVMEFLEGELLSERIEREGPLPVRVVCDVTAQLVDALDHSHTQNVVHGDLKPDNVVCVKAMGDDRRKWGVKLLDYGMAHLVTTPAGPQERIGGTPEYLAPERIRGGPQTPSVDVYALGMMMYEMLAGAVPFADEDPEKVLRCQLDDAPAPISARRGEELDRALVELIDRAIAKSPDERYGDVRALGADLRAYMKELGLRRRASRRLGSEIGDERRTDVAAAAFDALGVPAAGLLTDGVIAVANPKLARLVGAGSKEQLEGTNILETRLARLHQELREDLRLVAMDGKTIRRRLHLQLRGGRALTLRMLMTPADGDCGHCMLVLHPIPADAGGG